MKVNNIITEFIVKDVKSNTEIFCKYLGFKMEMAEPTIENPHWAKITNQNHSIMFFDKNKMKEEFSNFLSRLKSTNLTLIQYSLKEVKAAYNSIKEKSNLKIFEEIQIKPYGTTEFGFYLPDGYIVIITS